MRTTLLLPIAILALALAGCGSSDEPAASSEPPKNATAAPAGTLDGATNAVPNGGPPKAEMK